MVVTGFSQGGGLSFTFGIKKYNLIDAIIPIGGWLDEKIISSEEIEVAKDLPVYIIHGNKDEVVKYDNATKAHKILQDANYRVELLEFDGAHRINKEKFEEEIKKVF